MDTISKPRRKTHHDIYNIYTGIYNIYIISINIFYIF